MRTPIVICGVLSLATIACAAPATKDKDLGFQKKADGAAWEWSDEQAKLEYSVTRCKLKVETNVGDQRQATITVTAGKGESITFEGHTGTSFIAQGTKLHYADFHQMSTGCMLIAMDLKTGKQLFKTALKGLGPIDHFKYYNSVAIDIDESAIRILGKESSGRYIEFVDLETGKTVGHKVFPKE